MQALTPTKHALKRMQQRSISEADIDLIVLHGDDFPGNGVILSNHAADQMIRSLKHEITRIERLRNRKVVIDGSAIITCYPCKPSEMQRMRRLAGRT